MKHKLRFHRLYFIASFFVGAIIMSTSTVSAASAYYWTEHSGAGTKTWQDIDMSADANKLISAEYGGNIWTSDDGGTTWTAHTTPGVQSWRFVASSADGKTLAAAPWLNGTIWTSDDGGTTWRSGPSSVSGWGSIDTTIDGSTIVAVDRNGGVWYSNDSGTIWGNDMVSSGIFKLVAGTSGSIWFGLTSTGAIMYDLAAHMGFNMPISAGLHMWQSIDMNADGSQLIVGESGGAVWISKDNGATWVEQTSLGFGKWQAVASNTDGSVLVAADINGSGIWASDDAGATWTPQSTPGNHYWYYLASSADGTTLAAVDDGKAIWMTSTAPVSGNTPSQNPATQSANGTAQASTSSITAPKTGFGQPHVQNSELIQWIKVVSTLSIFAGINILFSAKLRLKAHKND